MKIAQSAIQLASSHTAVEYSESQESLTVWQQGGKPLRSEGENDRDQQGAVKMLALAKQAATVTLSTEALEKASAPAQEDGSASDADPLLNDLNLQILRALVERLTGRKIKMVNLGKGGQQVASAKEASVPGQAPSAPAAAGWGVRYERHQTYQEAETSQFTARGVVTTADGQQITIAVDLNLSRSFTSTQDESFQAGDALKDPLVINFEGTAAQLTRDTFSFDIDADGQTDQVSFVEPGSGFLALDANNDGTINNGSELFGALSGNGFAELASYDGDKNGWIDANDAVYFRLRIWSKDASGQDQLLALGDKGIGALYLASTGTPFAIKDSSNELQGQVRSTGLFLREEGGAGALQQLDLVA